MTINRVRRPSTINEELVTNKLATEEKIEDGIKETAEVSTAEVLRSVEKCQDNALETEKELAKTAKPVVDVTASEHKDEVFGKLEEGLEEESTLLGEDMIDEEGRKNELKELRQIIRNALLTLGNYDDNEYLRRFDWKTNLDTSVKSGLVKATYKISFRIPEETAKKTELIEKIKNWLERENPNRTSQKINIFADDEYFKELCDNDDCIYDEDDDYNQEMTVYIYLTYNYKQFKESLEEEKPLTEEIDVKDRKELATLIKECKTNNRKFTVKRSVKEGFRYTLVKDLKEDLDEESKGDLIDELVTSGECKDRAEAEEYIDHKEEQGAEELEKEAEAEEAKEECLQEAKEEVCECDKALKEGTSLDNPYAKEAAQMLIDARKQDLDTLGVIVSFRPANGKDQIKVCKIVKDQGELNDLTQALESILGEIDIEAIYDNPEQFVEKLDTEEKECEVCPECGKEVCECNKTETLEETKEEEPEVEAEVETEEEVCPECGEEECVCDETETVEEEPVVEEPAADVTFTAEEVAQVATEAVEAVAEQAEVELDADTTGEIVDEKVEEAVAEKTEEVEAPAEEEVVEEQPEEEVVETETEVEEPVEEIPEFEDDNIIFFEALDDVLDAEIIVDEPREIKDTYDAGDFDFEDMVDSISFISEDDVNPIEENKTFNFDIYKTTDGKYVAFGDDTPFGPVDDVEELKDAIRDFMKKSDFEVKEEEATFELIKNDDVIDDEYEDDSDLDFGEEEIKEETEEEPELEIKDTEEAEIENDEHEEEVEESLKEAKEPIYVVRGENAESSEIVFEGTHAECEDYIQKVEAEEAAEFGEDNPDTFEYFIELKESLDKEVEFSFEDDESDLAL